MTSDHYVKNRNIEDKEKGPLLQLTPLPINSLSFVHNANNVP